MTIKLDVKCSLKLEKVSELVIGFSLTKYNVKLKPTASECKDSSILEIASKDRHDTCSFQIFVFISFDIEVHLPETSPVRD